MAYHKITIEDLIDGHSHVCNLGEKTENLSKLLNNVIKPLEESGHKLTVTRGLLSNTEVGDISDVFLRKDHIYGFGVDVSLPKNGDTDALFSQVAEIKFASVREINGTIHLRYEEIPEYDGEDPEFDVMD